MSESIKQNKEKKRTFPNSFFQFFLKRISRIRTSLLPDFFFKKREYGPLYNQILEVGRNLERAAEMSYSLFMQHFVLDGELMT